MLPSDRLRLATGAAMLLAGAVVARAGSDFELAGSPAVGWEAEGDHLVALLEELPPRGRVELPRLDNELVQVFWEPAIAAEPPPATASLGPGEYLAPALPAPEQILSLSGGPDRWVIDLPDPVRFPARVVLQLIGPPAAPPAGQICTAAADGAITLPARHAIVSGEKLQFEPLLHKNTVGYWVNPSDAVCWRLATDRAADWDLHVLQGCGAGQGGSRIRFEIDGQSLDFTVVETGHFQNFRWKRVGRLTLSADAGHTLRVSCVAKAKGAVMDIRQLRLVPAAAERPAVLDIRGTEPDVIAPPLTSGPPAAGRRVLQRLADGAWGEAYHTLSLPTDWQPGRRYPVLAEWAGNGPYRNAFGDSNSGRVEDAELAHGLAGTDGCIVLGLPYLNDAGTRNVSTWWGTPPDYASGPTVAYAKAAIKDVCERFGGDAERVVLVGFSRGSIACNALGLADDEIASRWMAAVCFSHYDGVKAWPYAGSDKASARARLARLAGKRQLILAESRPRDSAGEHSALAAIRHHLDAAEPPVDATFLETGYRNHDDAWALRPSPARRRCREWLEETLGLPPRGESL